VGDIVDVLASTGGSYGGSIIQVNCDGTYGVSLNIGKKEFVPASDITLIWRPNPDETGMDLPVYEEGDFVSVKHEWTNYPGRVTKANADGTYVVKFNLARDGTRVYASHMKLVLRARPDETDFVVSFHVGDAVDADVGGTHYDSTIAKDNGDGTYGVALSTIDGYEPRIRGSRLKLLGSAKNRPVDPKLPPHTTVTKGNYQTYTVSPRSLTPIEKAILIAVFILILLSFRSIALAKLTAIPYSTSLKEEEVAVEPQQVYAYTTEGSALV
jgi:hypothetical protein